MNRKDIEKEIRGLISLKNKYNNEENYDKAQEVQESIRKLKLELKTISSKSKVEDSGEMSHSNSKTSSIPEIPDVVVINNIDITDMLHKLKEASSSTSANEIYNSIINLCNSRKNYINSVLRKNINSYEIDTELELSDKPRQAIRSLESYIELDDDDIEKKISELMNSIDSYDIYKSSLKLKSNVKRSIKRIKSNGDKIGNKVSLIANSIGSYIISKKGLKLKPKVKKAIMSELLNLVDSYVIDKSSLVLKPSVISSISDLKSRKDLNSEEIDRKVSELFNSVNSYDVNKDDLVLKPRVMRIINLLDNCKDLFKEKMDKNVLELINSIDSYIIDKNCLKLKSEVKRLIASLKSRKDLSSEEIDKRISELLNSVDSYNINKDGLELKSKVKQTISSLKSCRNLSKEEINRRISKIMDLVDSYNVDKKSLKLKSTLYDEICYINNIISIAYRLLVDIKRIDVKEIQKETTSISLTKKQERILNGLYGGVIPECSIDDYYIAFKYFVDREELDKEKLIFIVTDFFSKFKDNKSGVHTIEAFIKLVKKKTKDFSNSDKKTINSIMRISDSNDKEELENDYRYEVLIYFLNNKDMLNIEQIISNMPDIAFGYYDKKSVVVDLFSKVLDTYNVILCNYKKDIDIVDVFEEAFIKLYSINNKEKNRIECIIGDYIQQLKTINCSTVSKNIILYRLNRIREKMGITQKIDLPEIDSENYRYLDYYYKEEISNFERRKQENSVLLSGSSTVSYSVLKDDANTTLKINVVDLTPYFIDGTDLNELAVMDCVDSSKMKKYIRFETGKISPSITFEFHFYNGMLRGSSIYDSVVNPISDDKLSSEYNTILDSIRIFDIKHDFNDLIKLSLERNAGPIPYIVKYNDEDNKYYKIITDLNYIFSKLDKAVVDSMHQMFKKSKQRYGLSSDIVGKMDYDISVLEPTCNIYDILMQKIIKSYYSDRINLDINTVSQYVKRKG